ncbi:MAG: R3H domain-containing nucleic acid-binding protein [Patescibacteria group bacterium]
MDNAHETIEKSVNRMLELMDFDADCSIKEELDTKTDRKNILCSIKTKSDSRFLIGQHGSNLYALEHILRSILYKKGFSDRVTLDINGYKEDKDRMIANIAKDAANQASGEKKPIVLRPMNAYERRIVHMTVDTDDRVETESIGEREERKVIIKPKSIMNSL